MRQFDALRPYADIFLVVLHGAALAWWQRTKCKIKMNYKVILFTIGVLVFCIGLAELLPAYLEYHEGRANAAAFLESAFFSLFIGGLLIFSNRFTSPSLSVRQGFMLTVCSWLVMSLFAAIPLYISNLHLRFVDAFFEAISGITTTGSTVLSDLEHISPGILLWRSLIQWIGGIGVIAFAIVFLPFLRVGGMQLFQTESSDTYEKVMPRSRMVVASLLKVYVVLTVLCLLLYHKFGMGWFDAINHALTTVPTGGYSTYDTSFGHFESARLQITATVFMFLGSIPFILYVKLAFKRQFGFFKDDQVKAYLLMLSVLIPCLGLWLWTHSPYHLGESLRLAAFNIVSVVTTTGYAVTDYTSWGHFPILFFFFLTYLGACAGSTSGGLKVMRIVILVKAVKKQFRQLLYPNGVFAISYQGQPVQNRLVSTVLGFLSTYVVVNVLLSIALAMTGLDAETALSAAATSIANVGPGIGEFIGPSGNFAGLPDTAKWLLCLGMLAGRLEILTVMVLFAKDYWNP